jgi:catechol 2,3-dioxygenase-like lactoylglutathione lyase family enzyme
MKINFKRLDHVQIIIPKGGEKEARDFYSGILGLREINKPDSLKPTGGVWFVIGDVELHLGVEEPKLTKRHPAFEVDELEKVKGYLMTHGVTIKEEIEVPGRKRFSLFDPFGNRIELLEKG